MYTRLLVPLDGTSEAAAALPAAQTLARATGATLTLIRVTADGTGDRDPPEAGGRIQQIDGELRATAEQLARDDLRVECLVRTGPVAEAIIEAARSRNADLIVMATHGRTGLARALAGSTSERVIADSGLPVLVLKPDGERLDRIATLLVPVDGTAGGVLGLANAVGLALATGAHLIVVDVVPPMPMWMYSSEASVGALAYFDPAWEEEALHGAESYVAGLAERLRKEGLHVETRALRGEVASTIHMVAEETHTDLVVMSTHAYTGPARALLGSVADAVVRTSHRPVLLVRRHGGSLDGKLDDSCEPVAEYVAACHPRDQPRFQTNQQRTDAALTEDSGA